MAERDEPQSTHNASNQNQLSGSVSVDRKPDEGGGNSTLYAPQGGGQGYGRITPAKLVEDRIEEGCEAMKKSSGAQEMDRTYD